jgi:hypothetical protein
MARKHKLQNIFLKNRLQLKTLTIYGITIVMNQVGNSNFPPSVHLIFFFFTNIRNENNTREIQKWPRARDRTSLISLRCVFFNTN